MKKILTLLLLTFSISILAQNTDRIEELNYAGHKIKIPENCEAKSEYELLDCDGKSVQWLYLNEEMLKSVPGQFINQFENQPTIKSKTDFKVTSFNSELQGYKFKRKNKGKTSYTIIVYGTVGNQPLLLNIGTEEDIKKNSDLNEFLKQIIQIN